MCRVADTRKVLGLAINISVTELGITGPFEFFNRALAVLEVWLVLSVHFFPF